MALTFSKNERELIRKLSVIGGWNEEEAEGLKRKIRDYLIGKGLVLCCYCRLDMHKRHRFDLDTEHILPKGKYPEHTFELMNLSISCKRCNMQIKREDDSFFSGDRTKPGCFQSQHYSIAHPNSDNVTDHISVIKIQVDDGVLVKYTRKSPKGEETYRYFQLKDFESDTLDEAQGLDNATLSESIPGEIAERIRDLIDPEEQG